MSVILSGRVIKGRRKGTRLGFPTANIRLDENIESGVYAGFATVDSKKHEAGIFVGNNSKILEAHLIGFSGDIYGKEIEIEMGQRVRNAGKFKNDEDLKEQIKMDVELISKL